jgi:O-methyltransferase
MNVHPIMKMPRTWAMMKRVRHAGLSTLIDFQRLQCLRRAAKKCRALPGDFIEFGCYKGGSAGVIGLQLVGTNKTLRDSFQGMPETSVFDNFHKPGDFGDTSEQAVRSGLSLLGVPFEIHTGPFSNTTHTIGNLQLAFAHIDTDLYASVKESLHFCYQHMTAQGIIIFDDYGAPTCQGAKRAVDEFFVHKTEKPEELSAESWGVWLGHRSGLRAHIGVRGEYPLAETCRSTARILCTSK